MQPVNFDEALEQVLARDPRYARDAYFFLREALDYTQKAISKANQGKLRHVTGQELLGGIRDFALAQFGPMTLTVFHEWGVTRGEDFGEMVYNLIDQGVFSKHDTDTRTDFAGLYDFEEVFRKPFLPSAKLAPPAGGTNS